MISRHWSKPSVVFAGVLAWLTYALTGCSSGELDAGLSATPVATEVAGDSFCTYNPSIPTYGSATRSTKAWWSLGSSNFLPFVDVNTDLACGVSLSTAGQVICYLPDTGSTPLTFKITNWGVSSSGVPVASSAPKGVAILKHTEKPVRQGGGNYGIYVLLADSRVMVTQGDSDHWYDGTNFKTYTQFMAPVSSTGQTLSFKKIVWVNEDGMSDFSLTPRLLALTNDNVLYYTSYAGQPWKYYANSIRDMSHLPGRGDTIVMTSGDVYYGAFNPSNKWHGYLPKPASSIVAVGGLYALTNDGCGGNCSDDLLTFCFGDATRILHFDWLKWKWEPFYVRLTQEDSRLTDGYFPISPARTCTGCSPQMAGSIVDPHGLGNNNLPRFSVGPFVNWADGSRTQYYNPQNAPLPAFFQQCLTSPCSGYCAQLPDGNPCEPDGLGARVCAARACVACGGTHQYPCPGLDCSKVPGGAAAAVINGNRQCMPRFQSGKFVNNDWGGTDPPASGCDWDPGSYKASCPTLGYGLAGLSFNPNNRSVDAALCRYNEQFTYSYQCSSFGVLVASGEQRRARRIDDWDFGSWKLECARGEYVTGASHKPDGKFHAVLCGYRPPGSTGQGEYCRTTVASELNYSTAGDFDPGYWETACADSEYIAGVSVTPSTSQVHALLCCTL